VNKLLVLLFALFLSLNASAAPKCGVSGSPNSSITILFVNGIMNNSQQACDGGEALYDSLNKNGIDRTNVFQTFVHNPTDGPQGDVNELRMQAALSSHAAKLNASGSLNGYYQQLGGLYTNLINGSVNCREYLYPSSQVVLPGGVVVDFGLDRCQGVLDFTVKLSQYFEKYASRGGVVVVPHSQGNFYTEAAYALLAFNNSQNLSKIKVVGVAAIAMNPVGGKYLTVSQDNALYKLQKANTSIISSNSYSPANYNAQACLINTNCTLSEGMDYETLRVATGSVGANVSGFQPYFYDAIFGANSFDSSRALFHEFKEVYLNERIVDASTKKSLPSIIASLVKDSITALTPAQPITFATLITTPSYDLFTDDTYGQCYNKSVGSASGTNTYTMTEWNYCLSGGQWVARSFNETQILGDYGVMYPESSKIIKDTGNNTYSVSYGSRAYLSGSYTQKGTGAYTHTMTQTASMYYFNINPNSYIYNNVSSLGALITNYNCANNSGYLSTGGQYGVMLCGSSSDTNGITRYFAVGDSSRTIVDRGTWAKLSFNNGVALIGLGDNSTIVTGDSNITLAYLKLPSESGVREGGSIKIGRTQTFDSYDRSAFNTFLAGKGLPVTVN